MYRRPPRSTRTEPLFPDTPLFRSIAVGWHAAALQVAEHGDAGLRAGRPGDAGGEIVADAAIGRNAGGLRLPHRLAVLGPHRLGHRSEEHTSALQSLMRLSYAVFCFKKKIPTSSHHNSITKTL